MCSFSALKVVSNFVHVFSINFMFLWVILLLLQCDAITCMANVVSVQKILEEINNADTGAPCSPQHLKKVSTVTSCPVHSPIIIIIVHPKVKLC